MDSATPPQSVGVRVEGFGLPRRARVLDRHEFRRIYRHGRRASGRSMAIVALRRSAPGHRLGLSVSKDHGGAVRRNKIKRLLREAFRHERPGLAGQFDIVIIPRVRERKLALPELRDELRRLVREVAEGRGRRRRPPKA